MPSKHQSTSMATNTTISLLRSDTDTQHQAHAQTTSIIKLICTSNTGKHPSETPLSTSDQSRKDLHGTKIQNNTYPACQNLIQRTQTTEWHWWNSNLTGVNAWQCNQLIQAQKKLYKLFGIHSKASLNNFKTTTKTSLLTWII